MSKQHIHILGVCGTFMGSLAQLAKASGFRVTGCDTGVYPPMSDQLQSAGIELIEGFDEEQLELKPDVFVVGNVVSRGNPLMEAILDRGLRYVSGPQWLADNILHDKWVLAVSGTHGKTTTSSMLAWVLEYAGFDPGYLIGGVPENFDSSARLGNSDFFVIEADEYDTAFFDKRSKFVHYKPNTLIVNNLEFDHADIFPDLQAIQTQFHHLLRLVPRTGCIIRPQHSAALDEVWGKGCWSETQTIGENGGSSWRYRFVGSAQNHFEVQFQQSVVASVKWHLSGEHNVQNALNAIAAARHVGIDPKLSAEALSRFGGVKRRMECVGASNGIEVYDDFAHHPTAIKMTLAGAKAQFAAQKKLILVIEPRSNTMKMGVHRNALRESVVEADSVYWYQDAGLDWSLEEHVARRDGSSRVFTDAEALLDTLVQELDEQSVVVVMSNGGFFGMPRRLLAALNAKYNIEDRRNA